MPLGGATICITGKQSMVRKDLFAKVQRNGGMISKSVTGSTTILIADNYEVAKPTQKVQDAQNKGLPVVSEDWLDSCLEHGTLVDTDEFSLNGRSGGGNGGCAGGGAGAAAPSPRARPQRQTQGHRLGGGAGGGVNPALQAARARMTGAASRSPGAADDSDDAGLAEAIRQSLGGAAAAAAPQQRRQPAPGSMFSNPAQFPELGSQIREARPQTLGPLHTSSIAAGYHSGPIYVSVLSLRIRSGAQSGVRALGNTAAAPHRPRVRPATPRTAIPAGAANVRISMAVTQMCVDELKSELRKFECKTNGLKADLQVRLQTKMDEIRKIAAGLAVCWACHHVSSCTGKNL